MKTVVLCLVGVGGLLALPVLDVLAQGGRQSYGGWQYNKEKNYHFREYRYKVNANDQNYQHQYAVYFKNDNRVNNKWIYYYNPQTQKYWGRYPTVHHETYKKHAQQGLDAWSMLPTQYHHKDIYQIEQKHWPVPKTDYCPNIPGASDGTPIMAPPVDLP